jgi:hypothetical protein
MMWLGSCPRCRGDLHLELDHFGEFISCLQCGAILDESQEDSLRALAAAQRFCASFGSRSAILNWSRSPAPLAGRG